MSFDWLIGYSRQERIPSREEYEKKKAEFRSFSDLEKLLKQPPFSQLGISEHLICQEVTELLRQRLLSALMPDFVFSSDNDKVKDAIREHLNNVGIESDENLVSAIKFLASNVKKANSENTVAKQTIGGVYSCYRSIFLKIMKRQNSRCSCCGCPLKYGENIDLDHILPAHLGDDALAGANWQFLCKECNRGKNEFLHYTSRFAQVATITTKYKHALTEPLRYAALERDGECQKCHAKPHEKQLVVTRRFESGCWVLDNVITYCVDCQCPKE